MNQEEYAETQRKKKVNEIVDEFLSRLKEAQVQIKVRNILLVGSNCSYNYTENSDLDIHIIAETTSLNCPDNLYPKLYSAYRSLFNKKLDINFYGIPVELYVETEDVPLVSNGCYSVLNDKWINEPDINAIPEVDQEAINTAVRPWEERYNKLVNEIGGLVTDDEAIADVKRVQENFNLSDFDITLEALDCLYDDKDPYLVEEVKTAEIDKIDKYIEDLYDLRRKSLAAEGEYSIGNLVFKEIRNKGYLDNLKDLKNKLIGRELSLAVPDTEKDLLQELFGLKKKATSKSIDKRKAIEELTRLCNTTVIVKDTGDFYAPGVLASEAQSIVNNLKNQAWVEIVFADRESISIPDNYKHNKTKLKPGNCSIQGKLKLA